MAAAWITLRPGPGGYPSISARPRRRLSRLLRTAGRLNHAARNNKCGIMATSQVNRRGRNLAPGPYHQRGHGRHGGRDGKSAACGWRFCRPMIYGSAPQPPGRRGTASTQVVVAAAGAVSRSPAQASFSPCSGSAPSRAGIKPDRGAFPLKQLAWASAGATGLTPPLPVD